MTSKTKNHNIHIPTKDVVIKKIVDVFRDLFLLQKYLLTCLSFSPLDLFILWLLVIFVGPLCFRQSVFVVICVFLALSYPCFVSFSITLCFLFFTTRLLGRMFVVLFSSSDPFCSFAHLSFIYSVFLISSFLSGSDFSNVFFFSLLFLFFIHFLLFDSASSSSSPLSFSSFLFLSSSLLFPSLLCFSSFPSDCPSSISSPPSFPFSALSLFPSVISRLSSPLLSFAFWFFFLVSSVSLLCCPFLFFLFSSCFLFSCSCSLL